MRHEPFEIGLAGKTARRRDRKRMLRTMLANRRPEELHATTATSARDEAFAGLSHPKERPNRLAVVSQLNEQLAAIDRQREQLARLLREIEVSTPAD